MVPIHPLKRSSGSPKAVVLQFNLPVTTNQGLPALPNPKALGAPPPLHEAGTDKCPNAEGLGEVLRANLAPLLGCHIQHQGRIRAQLLLLPGFAPSPSQLEGGSVVDFLRVKRKGLLFPKGSDGAAGVGYKKLRNRH